MRITKDQRHAALLHEDVFVRNTCLEIIENYREFGIEVTRLCQQAIDLYTMDDCFSHYFRLKEMELDQETAGWVLATIEKADSGYFEENWKSHFLSWLLRKAPATFLKTECSRVLKAGEESQLHQKAEIEEAIAEAAQFESLSPGEAFEMLHQHINNLPEDCRFAQAGTHKMSRWARQLIGADEGGDRALSQ